MLATACPRLATPNPSCWPLATPDAVYPLAQLAGPALAQAIAHAMALAGQRAVGEFSKLMSTPLDSQTRPCYYHGKEVRGMKRNIVLGWRLMELIPSAEAPDIWALYGFDEGAPLTGPEAPPYDRGYVVRWRPRRRGRDGVPGVVLYVEGRGIIEASSEGARVERYRVLAWGSVAYPRTSPEDWRSAIRWLEARFGPPVEGLADLPLPAGSFAHLPPSVVMVRKG